MGHRMPSPRDEYQFIKRRLCRGKLLENQVTDLSRQSGSTSTGNRAAAVYCTGTGHGVPLSMCLGQPTVGDDCEACPSYTFGGFTSAEGASGPAELITYDEIAIVGGEDTDSDEEQWRNEGELGPYSALQLDAGSKRGAADELYIVEWY